MRTDGIEAAITRAVLNGAKTADVAVINNLKYAACRELIHKYCKWVNQDAYDRLNIKAAHKDNCSPSLEILRENKHLFIGADHCHKTQSQLKEKIKVQLKRLSDADVALREERAELDQLLNRVAKAEEGASE